MSSKADPRPSPAKPLIADETPRSLILGGQAVSYTLRRSRRCSIGLSVDHRGLRVGAPQHASLGEVETLILRHEDWVTRKLAEWAKLPSPTPLLIADGIDLPLLGQPLRLRLAIGSHHAVWNEQSAPVLTLCLRKPAEAPRLLEKALRTKAKHYFSKRLLHFAGEMRLPTPPLTLSSARTRWGSCSRKTGVRLNWRLIHFAPHVIDYVVIHELAHLIEMNHSPRFWAIVARYYPQHRETRLELKRLAATCPRW